MPFPTSILDDLAKAGANIGVDAATTDRRELQRIVQLWNQGSGNVTIRNASQLDQRDLVGIAQALNSRVTLEE